MKENTVYLPVNWVDGMKLNKTHLVAQDNAFIFQLAQNTSCLLNELNYGILPVRTGENGLKVAISTDNQKKLQVRIQYCRAITAGGHYIEIGDDTGLAGNSQASPIASVAATLRELRSKSNLLYIVLTINPYERLPHGVMTSPETPPRVPYSLPTLTVDLIPTTQVAKNIVGPFQLVVGKMQIDEQRVMLIEDYIPACSSVASHPDLIDIHAALEQFYAKLETYATQIVQKILQKKQANDMSVIVQKLCEATISFTATQITQLRSAGTVQPPVYLITQAAALSRLMKNTLDLYIGSGKEELANYFTEWSGISQGELESAIADLSTHTYDHLDINESVARVSRFTKLISKLFHQLARLEYIGKRKDAGIFVKEEVVKAAAEPSQPKRRSFLAD